MSWSFSGGMSSFEAPISVLTAIETTLEPCVLVFMATGWTFTAFLASLQFLVEELARQIGTVVVGSLLRPDLFQRLTYAPAYRRGGFPSLEAIYSRPF